MKFNTNNEPQIKSKNDFKKILLNIFLTLIPILIYKTIITNYINIVLYLLVIIINIILLVLFDLILKNKNYKFYIYDYLLPLIILISIYLFIPRIDSTNIIYITITNQLILFIYRIINSINPISVFLIMYSIVLENSINVNYNLYILGVLILLDIIYLIMTRSIKFRIILTFLSIGLLSLLFKSINIEIFLLITLLVIPYLFSTPIHSFTQYLYGIIASIIFILTDFKIFIITILILSILIKYIDLYFGIYLAKKKSS